jgi:hypothetical protein
VFAAILVTSQRSCLGAVSDRAGGQNSGTLEATADEQREKMKDWKLACRDRGFPGPKCSQGLEVRGLLPQSRLVRPRCRSPMAVTAK